MGNENRKINKGLNFSLRVYSKKSGFSGKPLSSISTHSLRRFLGRLRSIEWKKHNVYIRVYYPKTQGHNDGEYTNFQDCWHAFGTFVEDYHKPEHIPECYKVFKELGYYKI